MRLRILPSCDWLEKISNKLLYSRVETSCGKNFFTWMGTRPVVHFLEPTMIREAMVNHNQFQKPKRANPLAKLLVTGLLEADGDWWAKHRKITNPAFHVEKLKIHPVKKGAKRGFRITPVSSIWSSKRLRGSYRLRYILSLGLNCMCCNGVVGVEDVMIRSKDYYQIVRLYSSENKKKRGGSEAEPTSGQPSQRLHDLLKMNVAEYEPGITDNEDASAGGGAGSRRTGVVGCVVKQRALMNAAQRDAGTAVGEIDRKLGMIKGISDMKYRLLNWCRQDGWLNGVYVFVKAMKKGRE
ncbi:cytochrome P450 CYP72A219-like protein [Tanacetum coccineum]